MVRADQAGNKEFDVVMADQYEADWLIAQYGSQTYVNSTALVFFCHIIKPGGLLMSY